VIVGSAATEAEVLAIAASARPDLVLVDWTMASAPGLAAKVLETHPGVRILALGITEVKQDVLRLAEAGISGYVTRDATLDDLRASAESAIRGETLCSPHIVAGLMERLAELTQERRRTRDPLRLTSREQQVAALIDEGLSNIDIAHRLSIEVPTVKNHVHSILEKLRVHRRGEAVARLRAYRSVAVSQGTD
jgi:DNA-binding NarL/FixJ family response regulator